MLYIHPDECVDCGACEPVCPVEAIFYENDVADQWAQFTHRERQVLRPARLPRRRRENRPAARRHRLCRQLRH
jgi:ferredoxin